MNDDAQVHGIHARIAAIYLDFALELSGLYGEVCGLNGIERALQPLNYFGLRGDRAPIFSDLISAGSFGPVTLNK